MDKTTTAMPAEPLITRVISTPRDGRCDDARADEKE